MTARAIPGAPEFVTPSEREVWELLVGSLRHEDVVLANVRLTDEKKDHEADLIVLLPGSGVVIVEVKGGTVWIDETDGRWHLRRRGKDVTIDPVDQARTTKYAVRTDVERAPRWRDSSRSTIRWAHAVVTPHSTFDRDFSMRDCPRWTVHDKADLADPAGRLWDVPRRQESNTRVPTEQDVALIVGILRGRHLAAARCQC